MGNIIICAVLLLLCRMKESRAVTPVFVQKGSDLLLELMKDDVPENVMFLNWNFDEQSLVAYAPDTVTKISPHYSGRVEFSVENLSMKLKNLQETDSGSYTARLKGIKEKTIEYYVTVQDPVSPVVLTVDSVSNSSDSCNLTVTCRTQDSHISSTFTCDTQTCSQEGGERSKVTTTGASLQVYLVNDSITCNHSNQVSWTENQEETKTWDFCPRRDGSENVPAGFSFDLLKTVVLSVGLTLMVSAVIIVILLMTFKKNKRRTTEEAIELH
ncbi:hypothetical protein Q5P01_022839 [Channa striata]|uniref:SLAM family member 9-like n=1 Tax=Channa striata TaxID=64152 RepID=A0AA88S474_CHASR|nr:hypothetical protein Q5P01_022839 [Channa striata]